MDGRHGEAKRGRLEAGDPAPPRHPPRGRGQVGLRELRPLEQRAGVSDQDERGVGEPDPSSRRFQQRQPRLALEHRELLGHGRGREPQCLGHRGDGAARVQLVQEAQPVKSSIHKQL